MRQQKVGIIYTAGTLSNTSSPLSTRPFQRFMGLALCFFGALASATQAEDYVFGYVSAFPGDGFSRCVDIAVDPNDNVYITGRFAGSVDFDGGPGVATVTSEGENDVFVCKYDPDGNYLWAKTTGGASYDDSYAIAVDRNGNVYYSGTFRDIVDADPGPGEHFISAPSNNGSFLIKLDTSGQFQWAWVGDRTNVFDIAVDPSNNVYFTGNFITTVDFDPGPGTHILNSAAGYDLFVVKWNANGQLLWGVSAGENSSGSTARAGSIAVTASGKVFLAGNFEGTVDFDPGSGVHALSSTDADPYVLALNADSSFAWVTANNGYANSLASDEDGSVYSTGHFYGTVDFDPGPGTTHLTSTGAANAYVTKWTDTGNLLWVQAALGLDDGYGSDLSVDSAGKVYSTGYFNGTTTFGLDAGAPTFTSFGRLDVFTMVLDSATGVREWVGAVGGEREDESNGIAIDSTGNIYTGGSFRRVADYDPGPGVHEITPFGSANTYLHKLEPQQIPQAGADFGATDADQILTSLIIPVAFSVLNNDSDGNGAAVLIVSAFDAVSTLGAIVSVNPDGTFSYDPTLVPALQALSAGDSVVDTFEYTVSDGIDGVVSTVTITVYAKGTRLPAVSWHMMCLLLLFVGIAGSVKFVSSSRLS